MGAIYPSDNCREHFHNGKVLSFPNLSEPPKGYDVERISQFALYELGQTLGKLRRHSGDVAQFAALPDLLDSRSRMEDLLKGNPVPLGVAEVRAKELRDTLNGMVENYYFVDDGTGKKSFKFPDPDAPKIPSWYWSSVLSSLEKFETVFAEEMRENAAYYVPRRGIFYTIVLVEAADEAFMKDLVPFIPQKALEDWKAAGRCLAFNLLSASGFHVARAVEAMVEKYYQFFCGKQPNETLHGWNDYIKALEAVASSGATPAPSPQTLAELMQMKDDFRNPIMHPRIVLSEANAKMLFNNGETLIIAMAQELCETTKVAQPSLSLVTQLIGQANG